MTTMISVDWDFFLWRGAEAKDKQIACSQGNIPSWMPFDWGHSEHRHPLLQGMLWVSRYATLRGYGLEPESITGFRDVTPDSFVADLTARELGRINDIDLIIADSHAAGYSALRYASEPVSVVHFDAHHDLGYSGVYAQKKRGETDCAAWLWHGLDRGLVKDVLVVYPNWRDTEEWAALLKQRHMRRFRKRVSCCTWDEWKAMERSLADTEVINVARSGAWAPPWFDKDFASLVDMLRFGEMTCMDCQYDAPPGADACTPREWDGSVAQQLSDIHTNHTKRSA